MRKAREKQKRGQGFTLVELIVVVTILALLIGLLTPRVFKQLQGAKRKIAESQLAKIKTSIERAAFDTGRFPSTEEGLNALTQAGTGGDNWNGPYLEKKDLIDPWGKPFIYRFPCQHGGQHEYDLFSVGPNGVEDLGPGGDDIRSWSE